MKWYEVKFTSSDNSIYRTEWFGKFWYKSFYDFIDTIKKRREEIEKKKQWQGKEAVIETIKRIF